MKTLKGFLQKAIGTAGIVVFFTAVTLWGGVITILVVQLLKEQAQ